ncbi:MAG: hypothetical protein NTZ74_14280 [Chloroflexi bacterium]|nr:hypothetical protein [Chloroflexota bacterium]
MAAEVEKNEETPELEPVRGFKGLLKITEVRMLLYVIPVALILVVIALIFKAN